MANHQAFSAPQWRIKLFLQNERDLKRLSAKTSDRTHPRPLFPRLLNTLTDIRPHLNRQREQCNCPRRGRLSEYVPPNMVFYNM
jgi:hypothetical protein